MLRERLAGGFGGFVCAFFSGDGGVEVCLFIREVGSAGDGNRISCSATTPGHIVANISTAQPRQVKQPPEQWRIW